MSTLKKIGIFVGAAAATVVAGPLIVGLGTIGAIAAGAGGLATGALAGRGAGKLMDKIADERKKRERQIGRQEAAAEYAIKTEKLNQFIESMHASMQDANQHYQLIIALTAVGMAAAEIEGNYCSQDKEDIIEFISGISNIALPDKVKQQVNMFKNNPPSLKTALAEVRKLSNSTPNQFKDVILLALKDDHGVAGEKFLQAWDQQFV